MFITMAGVTRHWQLADIFDSYVIIALAFYVYPDEGAGDLGSMVKHFFKPHA